jgi:hypothetical protein
MREKQNRTTISVRLAADEEVLVRRMARKRRTTVTAVIRDAVNHLAASEDKKSARPFDLMSDLIGSVHGERDDLSQRTGDRFAAIVREKAARRR